jgi:hypothetical protein
LDNRTVKRTPGVAFLTSPEGEFRSGCICTISASGLAGAFAKGLPSDGIEVLCIAAKKRLRRAGDFSPAVTVCNRAGSAAAGAHQGRYRPIDIDRSPGVIGSRRFNAKRVLQNI